jgi:hypothetical protein
MTTSIRARAARVVAVVALGGAAVVTGAVAGAPAADAATTNPCKVLKQSELQRVFGGTVGSGKKGFSTPVSAQCEYSVSADGDRPDGTVVVHLTTTRAKAAYTGLKKTAEYVPIDGVPNSLYAEKLRVVDLLQGDVLVGVQAGFTSTDPLPIHSYDDKAQLIQLAQLAAKRV